MPPLVGPAIPAGRLCRARQPVLQGEGLVLRPWRPTDADAVVAAYADPAIRRWHVRSMSAEEAPGWIAERQRLWEDERAAEWAVTDDTDTVLGRVGFRNLDLHEAHAEVLYWVLPAARGTGVAPRALTVLTRWAFDVVGFRRLELQHSTANEASCRVASKCGFAVEGTLREHTRHADGWHDMHVHARLAGDRVG